MATFSRLYSPTQTCQTEHKSASSSIYDSPPSIYYLDNDSLSYAISPPLRPENPLRCISSKLTHSPLIPFGLTESPASISRRSTLVRRDTHCSLRETKLIFAPKPSLKYHQRILTGSISDDSVDFEIIGVDLSARQGDEALGIIYAVDKILPAQPTLETSTAAVMPPLDATMFEQEHYRALLAKLQALDRSHGVYNGSLDNDMILPIVLDVVETDLSIISPTSVTSSAMLDDVWTPPDDTSLAPTPTMSREPSPSPPREMGER